MKRAVGTAQEQTYATTTYTGNGLPATVTDAKGNLTTWAYDGFDRKTATYYPDKVTSGVSSATDREGYGYDANGNVTSVTKRNGQTLTLAYDNLNRLNARTYPDSADNVVFAYDLLNRKTAAAYGSGSHSLSWAWDNAGRLASATAGGRTVGYQYDAAGNRTRTTWPETGFYVTQTYDALNRPTAIKELGTTNLATYAYDDLSRRTTVTLGNGTTTTSGYDNQGALNSLAHNLAGTAQDLTVTTTRNQAGELATHSWTNDLYQWGGAANGSKAYTANGQNQYTAVGANAIAYDGNGNLAGDGYWAYGYDLDNRLKSATAPGFAASLAYDPAGRLRQTTLGGVQTDLLYDGENLIAEYDAGNNVLRRYVHGPGIDEPLVWYEGSGTANKSWLYADHQGSIVGQANGTGTSTAIYSYGPYGEPNVTTGSRFRYTGQQYLGPLGLYYYKARFYSPMLGRFLQTDPIGYQDDLNLYAYVGNNPVNFTDPTGMCSATGSSVTGLFDSMGKLDLSNGVNVADSGWLGLASTTGDPMLRIADRVAGIPLGTSENTTPPKPTGSISVNLQTGNVRGIPVGVSFSGSMQNGKITSMYLGVGVVVGGGFAFNPRYSVNGVTSQGNTSGFAVRTAVTVPTVVTGVGIAGSSLISANGGTSSSLGTAIAGGSPSGSVTAGFNLRF